MTDCEKEKIVRMRHEGFGYTVISKRLNISVNTIKTFCRANNLGGVKAKNKTNKPNSTSCLNCGTELTHTPGKRKKKFCSSKCRHYWWNNNKNTKSLTELKCKNCHIKFKVYGNSNRKYCSHECYIKDRFKR